MSMELEVKGIRYSNFTAASCEIRLDALSNTFSFEAVAAEGEPLPFKGGESCRVIVDGNVALTGFIEFVFVSYDPRSHNINIQGRDKTGDLLDSSLSSISDLRAPITLKEIIEAVIKNIGSDLKVVEEVTTEPFESTQDVASPEPGDNAFKFLEKYSRKRQVLLTSNGDGDIVITSGSAQTAKGAIQHIIGAEDNNVLAANFSFDTTGRFNLYKFSSQLNPFALNNAGDTDISSVVNQNGSTSDPEIRIGRQLVLVSENPYSNDQNEARSKWEANIRKARGLKYLATVTGYRVDPKDLESDLWQINKLYPIIDDFLSKEEPMLLNSVTFTLNVPSGEQTSLGFVNKEAYSLELEKPVTSTTAGLFL